MLRGSLSIFSTIFAIIFLKRKFYAFQWIGIILTTISLVIVGIAGVQMYSGDNHYGTGDRIVGVILILIAQVLQGGQLVFDEFMLTRLRLPVMFVVGMEGIWGASIILGITEWLTFIIPGKDPSPLGGSLEFWGDTLLMIRNQWKLGALGLGAILSIGCYDCAGMTVTSRLSSVHRTILEALRTLTAWIAMLIIGLIYAPYGERWQKWSWLELGGFGLLVYSSLVFNNIVKLPFVRYN
jgi:drug/metabolite transporter (DMT)-like permease